MHLYYDLSVAEILKASSEDLTQEEAQEQVDAFLDLLTTTPLQGATLLPVTFGELKAEDGRVVYRNFRGRVSAVAEDLVGNPVLFMEGITITVRELP